MGKTGINQMILTPRSFLITGISFVKALKVPSLEYCRIFASYITDDAIFLSVTITLKLMRRQMEKLLSLIDEMLLYCL